MQCFQKDANLRVSAKKLLKHPWIMSARKTDQVVPQTTKYDQAIKSVQQWNEALKSPDHDSMRRSRPTSLSPYPTSKELTMRPGSSVPPKALGHSSPKPHTNAFISPELDNDNWDDDFASAINPNALKLPHLKPQDNFAGLLSADKLKAYASFENVVEEGKSLSKLNGADPLETVRPFTPHKQKVESKAAISNTSSFRKSSQPKPVAGHQRAGSNALPTQSKTNSGPRTRPKDFKEDAFEDYSDLIESSADDVAFQKKIQALQIQDTKPQGPKLLDPSELIQASKQKSHSQKSTSLRRFSSQEKHLPPGLARSQSYVEIQKYAEEDDEDPESFLEKDLILPLMGSDSGSDRGTLMMSNSKLSNNSVDEEDEYDDPFAQFEEEFDQMDLEANVARDRYARQCIFVEGLIGDLQVRTPDDMLTDLTEQLLQMLLETPELRSVIISSHGLLPILEILEVCDRKEVIVRLLKIVNLIISTNIEMLENLCFVGAIPTVSEFTTKQFPADIRSEAALFVRQICQSSTLALQMFISCGGLNVLVGFLEEDLETERDLVLIGVNGICSVFELQGPTPKNDFCRILTRSSILYPLSLVLRKLLDESGTLAEALRGRIVDIFLPFSQAENYVKEIVADRMVLKNILKDLKRMSPTHQITMLKFIKNISMLSTTHEALQNSNAIEVLTDLLSSSIEKPKSREVPNHVLHILFNLCRLSKPRQVDAALNGLIPILQKIIKTERPLKELALPILCDMAHSGNVGRRVLWNHKGLQFYISLLTDKYWQVTALDAIFVWLQEETAKVEQHLLDGSFSSAIVDCFNSNDASPDAFENFLEPLQKLLIFSPTVASTLAHPDLFLRTAQKLSTKKALVRGNLLRIIRSICDASEEQGGATLIRAYGLHDAITHLANHDQAVMVRELALELIKACDMTINRNYENSRQRPRPRRSSSSISTMSTPSPVFITAASGLSGFPGTPQLLRTATGKSLYDSGGSDVRLNPPRSSRLSSATAQTPSFRPPSSDGTPNSSTSTKSRLPRTNQAPSRLSRLSVANPRREEMSTPTHSPSSINPAMAARTSAARLPQSRRRRVTSSGNSAVDLGRER